MARRNKPPTCPYCGNKAVFHKTSVAFYRKDHGPVYVCQPCNALVGCHKGTRRPLGIPANKSLRMLRGKAHKAFDRLWRGGLRVMTRTEAYAWLTKELGIERKACHIGMFDSGQCKRVVELAGERLKQAR